MKEVARWSNRTWNFPGLMHRLAGCIIPSGDSAKPNAIMGILGALGWVWCCGDF